MCQNVFFNWIIQCHFRHRLELIIDVESYFITLVEATIDVINGALNCLSNFFFVWDFSELFFTLVVCNKQCRMTHMTLITP